MAWKNTEDDKEEDDLIELLDSAQPVKLPKDSKPTEIVVSGEDVEEVRRETMATPPKQEEVKKTAIEPETVRKEKWKCESCKYDWYHEGKRRPNKCPSCKASKIRLMKVEEQYKEVPKLKPEILKPLVAYPYQAWSEKANMPELALSPPEAELLSENLARVLNFYMADIVKQHGVLAVFLVALAIVTVPKVVIYKTRKTQRQEEAIKERHKHKPQIAQPKKELSTTQDETTLADVEEDELKPLSEEDKNRYLANMFGAKGKQKII